MCSSLVRSIDGRLTAAGVFLSGLEAATAPASLGHPEPAALSHSAPAALAAAAPQEPPPATPRGP